MKTTPDTSQPWKPKPGEYFLWDHPSPTVLYLCKWWDKNGIAYIVVKDVSAADYKVGYVTYTRYPSPMNFLKPTEKFLEEFLPELKEIDYGELYHGAGSDVKETFNGFMTKITTVS
jgi:hypothetical protein